MAARLYKNGTDAGRFVRAAAFCVIAFAGVVQAVPAQAAAGTAGVAVSATVLGACTTPNPALLARSGSDARAASQDCAPYSVTLQPAADAQGEQTSSLQAALLVSY
jgi:hypothetical protein